MIEMISIVNLPNAQKCAVFSNASIPSTPEYKDMQCVLLMVLTCALNCFLLFVFLRGWWSEGSKEPPRFSSGGGHEISFISTAQQYVQYVTMPSIRVCCVQCSAAVCTIHLLLCTPCSTVHLSSQQYVQYVTKQCQ